MGRIQPQGMMTNWKTRLNYILPRQEGEPICASKSASCKNINEKCDVCYRIQGKYTEFILSDEQ